MWDSLAGNDKKVDTVWKIVRSLKIDSLKSWNTWGDYVSWRESMM
jgi:hypothetical protein